MKTNHVVAQPCPGRFLHGISLGDWHPWGDPRGVVEAVKKGMVGAASPPLSVLEMGQILLRLLGARLVRLNRAGTP